MREIPHNPGLEGIAVIFSDTKDNLITFEFHQIENSNNARLS